MSEINASVKVKNAANVIGHQELFNDYPLMVSPRLATLIGLNEAILLQQVHYWIGKNINDPDKQATHFNDGLWWTYNQLFEWEKQFPFWSHSTIKRTIAALEVTGILVSGNYNKDKFGRPDFRNRTKWYTIDYGAIPSHCAKMHDALAQNESMRRMGDTEDDYGKSPSEPSINALAQIDLMQQVKMSQSLTETNETETKEKKVIIKDDNNLLLLLEEKRAQAASEAQRASFKNKKEAKEDMYIPRDWELNPVQREEVKQEFQGYGVTDEILDKRTKAFIAWHREHKTEDSVWLFKFKGFLENWLKKRAATPKEPKAKKVVDTKQQIGNMSRIDEAIIQQAAASRLREQEQAEAKERAEAERLANRTPFEVLKDEILCYLFAGNEILVAHCGLSNLHIQELDGDCLRFGGSMMTERVGDMITYQRKITEAVRALQPQIKRVEFV